MGGHRRVPNKRHLLAGIEETQSNIVVRAVRREYERDLGMRELACHRTERCVALAIRVEHDGRRIAGEACGRKCVYLENAHGCLRLAREFCTRRRAKLHFCVIHDLSVQLVSAARDTSWVEIIAAGLAAVYLLLAIPQRLECWAAAFVSSCLYVGVLFGAHLYMESALNAFYAAMAVYGFWQWQGGGGAVLAVRRWPMMHHLAGFSSVIALSVVSAYFLRRFTPAAWPFVDSMVTWSSVFATFLVARKVYENWYWWLVIDSVSLCLYHARGLYLTMLLFGLYLVLILIGIRQWRRTLPPPIHAAG